MSMDPRQKTLIIAGSLGAVLVGLIVVGALAYRARFALPQEGIRPPSSPGSVPGLTVPIGSATSGSGTPGSATSAAQGQNGITGVDPTPDFTHGADGDRDGLTDRAEASYGTDPKKADTDGDGWSDGDEVLKYGSDPKNASSTPETIEGHEKLNL